MLLFSSWSNFIDFSEEVHQFELSKTDYCDRIPFEIVSTRNFFDFFPIFLKDSLRRYALNQWQIVSKPIKFVTNFLSNFCSFREVFIKRLAQFLANNGPSLNACLHVVIILVSQRLVSPVCELLSNLEAGVK